MLQLICTVLAVSTALCQSSRYFFLGLIMGGMALCNRLWVVMGCLTGKMGNAIFILA
ncbi:MAG: hypothetical protein ACI906_004137 [Candidatus Latescibacterota bacterium]|jgi:hypothetical protein